MKDSLSVQRLYLETLVASPGEFFRVQNIYNPENFDTKLRETAEFISVYADQYHSLPSIEQLNAVTNAGLKQLPDVDSSHVEWFISEFERFTKRAELERAILKAADYLEKGTFDPVEKLIKDAVQISLMRDIGTDYYADPRARLEKIKSNNGQVSTGMKAIDDALYGGMNRGELNIFAGGSGSGKSLFMQNLACNWSNAGLNGVYITLELSEELTGMRMDSMLTGIASRDVFKRIDDVSMQINAMSKRATNKPGMLRIKYLPAQSTVNDIRAFLKELTIQTGKQIDFILVDYLDLLMPVSAKVSPNDLFVKDKYVSEELRNLSKEWNALMVTASQLNRAAVEEIEFNHSHISGGISKINTADNVFGIFTSRSMRESGRYQLQPMKTRNSGSVGIRIDLAFDVNTLKISDAPDYQSGYQAPSSGSMSDQIMNKIKQPGNSTVTSTPVPESTDTAAKGEVQSARLKAMLNSLKTTE